MMKMRTLWAFDSTFNAGGSSPQFNVIADRWRHDAGSVRFFRSSANAIVRLTVDGEPAFLRCAAASERRREAIETELRIIERVRQCGVPVVRPLVAISGEHVATVETSLGLVHAVLFAGIPGQHLEASTMSLDEMQRWGVTVGNLHRVMATVPAEWIGKPPGWQKAIDYGRAGSPVVQREAERLAAILEQLPRTGGTYGLLHNDLEQDNLIWQNGTATILDFDEYSMGWYLTDIVKALDEVFATGESPDGERVQAFLTGYRLQHDLDEAMLAQLPVFAALLRLQEWASLDRAIDMTVEEAEVDWMRGLIARLSAMQEEYEASLAG